MPVSLLSTCSDACGWTAAFVAVLSFGSFGVPIKYAGGTVDVHPLVMQSYKTTVCFLTCWGVLLLGEELIWSPYCGFLSGLFWVPGAAMGIFGIRNAGLAVAVGTWSSIAVLTSFFFGIIVFEEGVKDFGQTCLAFLCLIVGLIGMSKYSAPKAASDKPGTAEKVATTSRRHNVRRSLSGGNVVGERASALKSTNTTAPSNNKQSTSQISPVTSAGQGKSVTMQPFEMEPLMIDNDEDLVMVGGGNGGDFDERKRLQKDRYVFFGGRVSMTRRQMGVFGAVINGAWGGMCLIPLHFALQDPRMTPAAYLISYACGAFVVNLCIWIAFLSYYLYQKKGVLTDAVQCLPKFHFEQLLLPGMLAGLLYSLGNFGSIIAVAQLGQGAGYSFCQMQLFVSGLWGVLFFREINGRETIAKWFLSASVAVLGIIWLAYEHEGSAGGH